MNRSPSSVELAPGVTAHIGAYADLAELEAVQYIRGVWAEAGATWERTPRMVMGSALAVIRSIDGLPKGATWPDLPCTFKDEAPALDARMNALRMIRPNMETLREVDKIAVVLFSVSEDDEKK